MVAHGVTRRRSPAYDEKLCGPVSQLILRNRGAGPFRTPQHGGRTLRRDLRQYRRRDPGEGTRGIHGGLQGGGRHAIESLNKAPRTIPEGARAPSKRAWRDAGPRPPASGSCRFPSRRRCATAGWRRWKSWNETDGGLSCTASSGRSACSVFRALAGERRMSRSRPVPAPSIPHTTDVRSPGLAIARPKACAQKARRRTGAQFQGMPDLRPAPRKTYEVAAPFSFDSADLHAHRSGLAAALTISAGRRVAHRRAGLAGRNLAQRHLQQAGQLERSRRPSGWTEPRNRFSIVA